MRAGSGVWFDSAFAPRAVLLHKPEPAQDPGRYPPRVRRGRARWLGFGSAFAPWAVLLHETGAGAGGRTVGAPAPGANGGGLGGCGLTPLSHRGRCSYMKPGLAQDSGG